MPEEKVVVHGDIFTSDTRSVLAILEIGEADYHFKQQSQNTLDNALGGGVDGVGGLSNHTPVLEDRGIKRMGSGQMMQAYCCFKDRRNMPKRDEKGKLIKQKKGAPKAKSMCPPEFRDDIETMSNWYLQKLRPHTQHLIKAVLDRPDLGNVDDETIKKHGFVIRNDMEMVHMALQMLEKDLASNQKSYMAVAD